MGVENFVNSSVSGKRSAKRARVLLAAKLDTPHGEMDARLRDLSSKGALVECNNRALTVGTEVVFKRGSTIVPARVAWVGGGRVGLEFKYTIDDQEVLVQLKRAASGPAEPYRRPAITAELSDKDRKLAQAWGVTVGLNINSRNI